MITEEGLRELLRSPVESTSVDFKAHLDWGASKRARYEVLRDIACLANRQGGYIVVGLAERPGGGFEPTGLGPADKVPDVTELNVLLREHFNPTVPVEVGVLPLESKSYGVIAVPEFATYPLICQKSANDEQNLVALRRGALYVRSDAANCEEAGPAELQRIIDRSVERRGAAIRRMLATTESTATLAGPRVQPDVFEREAMRRYPTLRASDLRADEDTQPKRLRELEELIEKSRVRGGGGTYFPRYVDRLDSDRLTLQRLPGRVVAEAEAETLGTEGRVLTAVQVTERGSVSVRESLWEDARHAGQNRLGTTTVAGFVLATLLFGFRFYSGFGVTRFHVRTGLLGPLGRVLWTDSDRRAPFMFPHAATSSEDLWVERGPLPLSHVDTLAKRLDLTFDIVQELFDYFGWPLTAQSSMLTSTICVSLSHSSDGRAGRNADASHGEVWVSRLQHPSQSHTGGGDVWQHHRLSSGRWAPAAPGRHASPHD